MAVVYSTLLVAEQGLSAPLSLTVPPGYIWILRDLDLYNGGGLGSAELFLVGSSGQAIYWARQTPGSDASVFQWRGRQVIEGGQSVTVNVTSGDWDVSLSGYVLSQP